MSFGAASRDGFPRVPGDAPCPCGSGDVFSTCCGALHRGAPAPTAERLMRSRYTAFVVGDARYLLDTWHPRTRPDDLALDAALRWRRLEIVATELGGEGDATGLVEFRAHWVHGAEHGEQHERSRFARQRGRWWYLDGDVGD